MLSIDTSYSGNVMQDQIWKCVCVCVYANEWYTLTRGEVARKRDWMIMRPDEVATSIKL
jgi:hypothetical protein